MSQDMLGISVCDVQGVVTDLLEKLGGSNGQEWLKASKKFLRKEDPWPTWSKPRFLRDMSKERGWTLEEEGPKHPEGLTGLDLRVQEFLNYDEKFITGEEFQKRAQKLNAGFGQHMVEYLLGHQIEIPAEWRKFYLAFPGTVWRGAHSCYVPVLSWHASGWLLYFFWLFDGRFSSSIRLVVPRA